MSNEIAEVRPTGLVASDGRLSAQQVLQHAVTVQEVMRSVMKPEIHYGKIPGTDKPTLLQPGADLLCMTFRIAQQFRVEDLSTSDAIRYRVTCVGVHQAAGFELGTGIGEASSGEEKYKWRKATSDKEFDATPPALRRVKFGKSWETKQVRTEPADVANTVLKMAAKRAKIAMVLNVTAASDMFGQDLEDLAAELREQLVGTAGHAQPEAPKTWPQEAFDGQFGRWKRAIEEGLKTADDIVTMAKTKGALTAEQEAQIRAVKRKPAPAPEVIEQPTAAADDFAAAYETAEGAQQ